MTLTKETLIKYMRDNTEFQLKKCRSLVDLIFEEIENSLQKGDEVKISGFGKWQVMKKQARLIRHPATGLTMQVAAKHIVLFSPSKKLRMQINQDSHAVHES